jgi:predicted lysophospholipase L1 biosynthesis ABC-type transport system permease subunit
LSIEDLSAATKGSNAAFSALPSTLAIDLDPGAAPGPVVDRIVAASPAWNGGQQGSTYQVQRVLGAAILNDAQMGDQPITLALVLALAVLVSLAATVIASARRRRHELAVLKALGFTRRQLRGVIAWQTTTILVIAAVLGLPLGVAAGRWAWSSFAASIGVVPVTVIPLATMIIGLLVLVGVGNALTAAPGMVAAHTPTADALRAE